VRLHGVIKLQKTPPFFVRSQSMVYSVSSRLRRQISLLWNELLLRRAELEEWPLLRLGLHPPDWKFSKIRLHALKSASQSSRNRYPMTYGCWVQATKQQSEL